MNGYGMEWIVEWNGMESNGMEWVLNGMCGMDGMNGMDESNRMVLNG